MGTVFQVESTLVSCQQRMSGLEVGGLWGLGRSDEGVLPQPSMGPVSPDLQSSTFIKVEQQLPEEEPCDMGSSEGPVSHTTEGQERPEVSVATWGSGDPGPVDGQPGTPPPEPPRLFRPPNLKQPRFPMPPILKQSRFSQQLKVFASDLNHSSHVSQTGLEHPEPKEAKINAPDQEAEAPPLVTTEVNPTEEQNGELEASPPPELSPPPAASLAAAVEPGPAPEETEAPPPLDEEPSMEPRLVPASEEELPLEGPSSTFIKVEQQLPEEEPCDMGSSVGPVSHTTEGQERPEVSVATWGSGDTGPVDGQPGTSPPEPPRLFRPSTLKQPRFPMPPTLKHPRFLMPPTLKQPRFNRQLKVFTGDLYHSSHVSQTSLEHPEPKEAKINAPDQEAEAAPPVTPEVNPEEQDVELEASPPPELSPPPAASPSAAVEEDPKLVIKSWTIHQIEQEERAEVTITVYKVLWTQVWYRLSSTFIKVEQQLPEEEPCDMGSSVGPVSHTTEGQERPEVSVATWGSGDPGPVDGQPGTPPLEPPRLFRPSTLKQPRFPMSPTLKQSRLNRQLKVFTSDLYHSSHVNQIGPEYPEPKEAKINGENLVK
uniref:Uncharacterized protein n=1 Tax=Pipistrellus kuhlii TaxID=59472 RepID=A0A7J7W3S8_PIPKU|nr:hypothetical protein mPipKuh1_008203 [Pipistrellus kuhlii]